MSYVSAVLADSPLHYWRFADPPGSLLGFDIGSNKFSMNAALQVATAYVQMGYSGPNSDGGAVYSNGNWYQSISQTPVLALPLSLECIIWPSQRGQVGRANVMLSSPLFSGPIGPGIDSASHWSIYTGSAFHTGVHAAVFQSWTHLVLTSDAAGNATLYANAISVDTTTLAFPAATYAEAYVGRGPTSTSDLFGAMSEVAVYGVALTPTQVNNHFLAIDNLFSNPVLKSSSGGLEATILAAVQKTFPTT